MHSSWIELLELHHERLLLVLAVAYGLHALAHALLEMRPPRLFRKSVLTSKLCKVVVIAAMSIIALVHIVEYLIQSA